MALFGKDDDETLQQKLARLGNAPVLSPMGATQAGASPHQAKMAGAPGRKQRVMQQATTPKEQTLAGAERLRVPGAGGPSAAQEQAAARADQLSQLGTLSGRVERMVNAQMEQQLAAAEQGVVGVDEDKLRDLFGGIQGDQFNAAKASLEKLATAMTPEEREAALYELAVMPEFEGVAAAQYLELGVDQTAMEAARQLADTLTLQDFDVTNLGFDSWESLRAAIAPQGTVEQVQGMSLTDLQKQLASIEKQQYLQVQSLQARLAAAVPGSIQAQVLQRQLRDTEEVGVRGVEQGVAELAEDINLANTIEIDGKEYTVSELLQDETLSEQIKSYLQTDDPELRDGILPPTIFSKLREWISRNQIALADVANDADIAKRAFDDLQDKNRNLAQITEDFRVDDAFMEDIFDTLGVDWDPNKPITTAGYEALKQAFDGSVLGDMLTADEGAFIDFMGDLSQYPDWVEEVLARDDNGEFKYTADQLLAAQELGYELGIEGLNFSSDELKDWFGLDQWDPFILDPNLQEQIKAKLPLIGRIKEEQPIWMEDAALRELDDDTLGYLLDNPDEYDDFKQLEAYHDELDDIESLEDALSFAFGGDITEEDIKKWNENYELVRKYAALGDKEAQKALAIYEQLDTSGDGILNAEDIEDLVAYYRGEVPELGDIEILDPEALKLRDQWVNPTYATDNDAMNRAAKLVDKYGRLTNKRDAMIALDEIIGTEGFYDLLGILGPLGYDYDQYKEDKITMVVDPMKADWVSDVNDTVGQGNYDFLSEIVAGNINFDNFLTTHPGFDFDDLDEQLGQLREKYVGLRNTMDVQIEIKQKEINRTASPAMKQKLEFDLEIMNAERAQLAKSAWRTHKRRKDLRRFYADTNVKVTDLSESEQRKLFKGRTLNEVLKRASKTAKLNRFWNVISQETSLEDLHQLFEDYRVEGWLL